ncbi:MAG: L,D-transpeptidase [Cyanobacteriota bacterium]|nr:L,D-transpeptidase [Cyanobacteriota bacterium]
MARRSPTVRPLVDAARPLGPLAMLLQPMLLAGLAAGPVAASPASPDPGRHLVLDRRARELRVLEADRLISRFPVAVGMPGWETPVGEFQVIEKTADPTWKHPATGELFGPGPANPLGSRWIGFHRDCGERRGFNGKEYLVVRGCATAGFHGTNNRNSIGQAASHGCVRLYEEHVRQLFELVSIGTPVTVLP